MRYRVRHLTRLDYQSPARLARFNLRLEPVPWPGEVVRDFRLEVEPAPSALPATDGGYPFRQARVELDEPFETLEIRSAFEVTVEDAMLDLVTADPSVGEVARAALLDSAMGGRDPVHYLFPSPLLPGRPEIAAWALPWLPPDRPAGASGLALAKAIQAEFAYDGEATEAETPVATAFALRRGVCQDFAHVLIEALRSAGLPAAYVSGYLRTTPPPGAPRLVGVDAMHAWVALWCGPQRGWVGLDPTNGCLAGSGHVPIAMGRDYSDVSPVDGIFVGGGGQRIHVAVDVEPLDA